jgi:hypothetical protein
MTTDFQVTGDHDCESGFVDVWVGGDGGDWSCSDSTLFRIPKELFDYHLLIGQLNTKHDLELLVESTRREMQLGLRNIDLREVLQDNTYPLYIDGQGWVSSCPYSMLLQ